MTCDTIKNFSKAPSDVLDYAVDYTKEMARYGDTVAASAWIIPSATSDDPGNTSIALSDSVTPSYDGAGSPLFHQGGCLFSATKAQVVIGGGTLGAVYVIENRATTANGRKYARRFTITIKEISGI